ncbi:MAG: hypothetical protein LBS89_05250 [Zoogloeaceae bacterium]|jgi:hypothetical protein|nr:hypothetical protein [Zoogloeaceae bacterium]
MNTPDPPLLTAALTNPTQFSLFGDPFRLEDLPLPRPAEGYAVQYLGRDWLLDRTTAAFLPIRTPRLQGLFPSFEAARQAALAWGRAQSGTPPLAIVPAAFDPVSERHILIYGVLQPQLEPETEAVWLPLP